MKLMAFLLLLLQTHAYAADLPKNFNWTAYQIKAERHSAKGTGMESADEAIPTLLTGRYPPLKDLNQMTYYVLFEESTRYQTRNPSNQGAVNKLFGFSDCKNNLNLPYPNEHHVSSARFGWRYNQNIDQIELLPYTYDSDASKLSNLLNPDKFKPVYPNDPIASVSFNEPIKLTIKIVADTYEFYVNDQYRYTAKRGCNRPMKGHPLFPYFGGVETAPHDMTIKLADEKNVK